MVATAAAWLAEPPGGLVEVGVALARISTAMPSWEPWLFAMDGPSPGPVTNRHTRRIPPAHHDYVRAAPDPPGG